MKSVFCFTKYQGTGNDFIFIDDRKNLFPVQDSDYIAKLCHRKWGIGADGLVLLQSSTVCHFRMRIFNSDGQEAASCGNALCCLMRFLVDLGFASRKYRIELQNREVFIEMQGRPVVHLGEPQDIRLSVHLADQQLNLHHINTGVPHAVVFTKDVKSVDIAKQGKEIRFHPQFAPHGANVNFAEVKEDGVHVRTYERGVEAETLACGTGATAVALIAHHIHQLKSPIPIHFAGGRLDIHFEKAGQNFKNIQLMGSAEQVFSGSIDRKN